MNSREGGSAEDREENLQEPDVSNVFLVSSWLSVQFPWQSPGWSGRHGAFTSCAHLVLLVLKLAFLCLLPAWKVGIDRVSGSILPLNKCISNGK